MRRRLVARSDTPHTSHQSAAAAGVAADVEVVPVAAAGNAVADGRSSVSSSLEDSRREGTECACTVQSRTVKRMF